jgi:hypothetical protein
MRALFALALLLLALILLSLVLWASRTWAATHCNLRGEDDGPPPDPARRWHVGG